MVKRPQTEAQEAQDSPRTGSRPPDMSNRVDAHRAFNEAMRAAMKALSELPTDKILGEYIAMRDAIEASQGSRLEEFDRMVRRETGADIEEIE